MYKRTREDARRVKRVRAKRDAAKRVEKEAPVESPKEMVTVKPPKRTRYTPSYFDEQAKKADASRETDEPVVDKPVKPKKKRKRKKDKR